MDYEIDLNIDYVYIINQDLKMSKGKIASQVSHVAMMLAVESIYQFNTYDLPTIHDDYKFVIGKAVVLKASGEVFSEILKKYGYLLCYVKEGDAGLTEVDKGVITCVGFNRDNSMYKMYPEDKFTELCKLSRTLSLV